MTSLSFSRYKQRLESLALPFWGLLLMGVLGNMIYLLWPQMPQTLILSPHPASLKSYADQLPVIVSATPPGAEQYMLIETASTAGVTPVPTVKPYRAAKHTNAKTKPPLVGKVNLNRASLLDLQRLPGIGPKMAEKIIAFRKAHGPFTALEQLLDVPGVGPKKFGQLQPYCSL